MQSPWDCQKWLNFFCRTQKRLPVVREASVFSEQQWVQRLTTGHVIRISDIWKLSHKGDICIRPSSVQGTLQKRSRENTRARGKGGELWDAIFQTQHRHYTTMNSQPLWLFMQDLHKIESIWWGRGGRHKASFTWRIYSQSIGTRERKTSSSGLQPLVRYHAPISNIDDTHMPVQNVLIKFLIIYISYMQQ